jgi:hypothetical protein
LAGRTTTLVPKIHSTTTWVVPTLTLTLEVRRRGFRPGWISRAVVASDRTSRRDPASVPATKDSSREETSQGVAHPVGSTTRATLADGVTSAIGAEAETLAAETKEAISAETISVEITKETTSEGITKGVVTLGATIKREILGATTKEATLVETTRVQTLVEISQETSGPTRAGTLGRIKAETKAAETLAEVILVETNLGVASREITSVATSRQEISGATTREVILVVPRPTLAPTRVTTLAAQTKAEEALMVQVPETLTGPQPTLEATKAILVEISSTTRGRVLVINSKTKVMDPKIGAEEAATRVDPGVGGEEVPGVAEELSTTDEATVLQGSELLFVSEVKVTLYLMYVSSVNGNLD